MELPVVAEDQFLLTNKHHIPGPPTDVRLSSVFHPCAISEPVTVLIPTPRQAVIKRDPIDAEKSECMQFAWLRDAVVIRILPQSEGNRLAHTRVPLALPAKSKRYPQLRPARRPHQEIFPLELIERMLLTRYERTNMLNRIHGLSKQRMAARRPGDASALASQGFFSCFGSALRSSFKFSGTS